MRAEAGTPGQNATDGAAVRHCLFCGASHHIASGEPLWPADWQCPSCKAKLQTRDGIPLLAPDLDEVDEGFELGSFERLAKIEDGHFWFSSRNELAGWLVKRFAPGARNGLEIGCGTGFVLYALKGALPDAHIAGSELHSRGLAIAKLRHGQTIDFIQMDARNSGLSAAVDLVGAFDVLEHIPEDDKVLAEIYRTLRPGGRLIATVPQHPWMWSTADDLAHHQRRYVRGELARKAERAGLRPLYQSSFVTLAFPLMVAARFGERMRNRPRSVEEINAEEFAMPPLLNGILLGLCRMEHVLRRLGVPLPFGGSQVLVAERPRQAL